MTVDIVSPEQRSRNMSAVRSRDTGPEVYLRKLLYHSGFRYRKNAKDIFGHPDIWLPKYRTAVFVHGCFWHRHEGCRMAYTPKTRTDFWNRKFEANVRRDREVLGHLTKQGIRCTIVWECEIRLMRKDAEAESAVLSRLIREITAPDPPPS